MGLSLPYDASVAALIRPGEADDFFPVPVQDEGALCAEMSRLAYVMDPARLKSYLSRVGFDLVRLIDVPGAHAFVAQREGTRVVTFRGTVIDDPFDIFTDLSLALTDWKMGGRAHAGFIQALDLIWDDLRAELSARKRVLFTGHSLGGALATLAATLRRPDALVTIGSPRVGDADFAALLSGLDYRRFVGCCDGVCRVPPRALGYEHAGSRIFIDRRGALRPEATDAEIERERLSAAWEYLAAWIGKPGHIPSREMADHAPVNYTSAILGIRGGL